MVAKLQQLKELESELQKKCSELSYSTTLFKLYFICCTIVNREPKFDTQMKHMYMMQT